MIELKESRSSAAFLTHFIDRSNKFHKMFSRGRGHADYMELAKVLRAKAKETVNFSTTRFSRSSYEQWEKIYESYTAFINAFSKYPEDPNDECDQIKYLVRGQNYAVDLCGVLDVSV